VAPPRASDFRPGAAGRTRAVPSAGSPARQLVLDVRQTAPSSPGRQAATWDFRRSPGWRRTALASWPAPPGNPGRGG